MGDKIEAGAMSGHCLCGAVQVTLQEPKPQVEICHCDMCRRWTGGSYAGASGGEATVAGEESVGIYRSSEWAERAFCRKCGSNLWYRFLPTGHRSFLAGLFADADGFAVAKEIFVDEKPAWSDLSGEHPRQTGAETIAEAKAAGFGFG